MKGYIILFLIILIIFFSYIFYQVLYVDQHKKPYKIFDISGNEREMVEGFANINIGKIDDIVDFFKDQKKTFSGMTSFIDKLTKSLKTFNKNIKNVKIN